MNSVLYERIQSLLLKHGNYALCKEPVIATSVEEFKIATLTKSYIQISFVLMPVGLSISFSLTFCWIEGYGKYALYKEPVIATFVER